MKLYFDKRLKDPTYYAQQGIRNGKKTREFDSCIKKKSLQTA